MDTSHPPHPTKLETKLETKMKRGNKKFRPTRRQTMLGKTNEKNRQRETESLKEADKLEAEGGKKGAEHPERQKQIPLLRTTGRQFFLNTSEMRKSAKWIIIFHQPRSPFWGGNIPIVSYAFLGGINVIYLYSLVKLNMDRI